MIFSSSSKPLTISDFEGLLTSNKFDAEAVIGRPLIGNSTLKAVSYSQIQRFTGATSSIVSDFKKALSQKYGAEIADFVFPEKDATLVKLQGLKKKTIASVLKRASLLEVTDFLNYQEVLKIKENIASDILAKWQDSQSYEELEQKYRMIQANIEEFENTRAVFNTDREWSEEDLAGLKKGFQEKVDCVTLLTRDIMHIEASELLKKIFGASELPVKIGEMAKIVQQHTQVIEELCKLGDNPQLKLIKAPPVTEKSAIETAKQIVVQVTQQFNLFAPHLNENPLSVFTFNEEGAMILQQEVESTDEVALAAAAVFFDTLQSYYGASFINQLRPENRQSQPLTVGEANNIFQEIRDSFGEVATFFQRQPLLITLPYLEQVSSDQQLEATVRNDHEQLGSNARLILGNLWELMSLATLKIAYSVGGLTYAHVGLLVPALHCPPALLAIAMGTVGGAVAGRIVTIGRNEHVINDGIQIGAIFGATDTISEIESTILENVLASEWTRQFMQAHIPLSEYLFYIATLAAQIPCGEFFTELGMSSFNGRLGLAARNAFLGGSLSGALGLGTSQNTTSSNPTNATIGERDDNEVAEAELSLERRLFNDGREVVRLITSTVTSMTDPVTPGNSAHLFSNTDHPNDAREDNATRDDSSDVSIS